MKGDFSRGHQPDTRRTFAAPHVLEQKGSVAQDIRESPTLPSRDQMTGQTSLRESPTKQTIRESPTKATDIRESPTEPSRGGAYDPSAETPEQAAARKKELTGHVTLIK
jgi:hypothetical protein